MKRQILFTFLFSFILISQIAMAQDYYATYYWDATTNSITPSLQSTQQCEVQISASGIFNSTVDYTVLMRYRSPENTVIATSSRSFSSGYQTCTPFGTGSTTINGSEGHYESLVNMSSDASVSSHLYTTTIYACNGSANNNLILTFENDSRDHFGQYATVDVATPNPNSVEVSRARDYFNYTNFADSCTLLHGGIVLFSDPLTATSGDREIYFYVPINSSNGEMNVTVDMSRVASACSPTPCSHLDTDIQVYPLDNPSGATSICAGSGTTCNGTHTVTFPSTNTEYVLFYGEEITVAGGSTLSLDESIIVNASIDVYQPNYECSDWSGCTNNTRQRTCIDADGIAPDLLEVEVCDPVLPYEYEIIGFEEYEEVGLYECKKDGWTCVASPENVTTKIPVDWNVTFFQVNDSGQFFNYPRFIDMVVPDPDSGGLSTPEGSLALALWYDPPSVDTVTQSGSTAVCDNATIGFIPSPYRNLNQSVFVDITFPTSTTSLAYWTRKMDEPIVQYRIWNPVCSPYEEVCYGVNCTQEPLGNYEVIFGRVNETDNSIEEVLLEYFDVATSDWDSHLIDLSSLNLQSNTTYRVVFAVIPPDSDVYRQEAVGVYFDNVQVSNLFTAVSCIEFCNGTDLYVPTVINGSCIFDIDENNTECALEVEALASSLSQNETNASLYDPIDWMDDLNVTDYLESSGAGFMASFFSTFFLSLIIIFIIAGYGEYKIGSGGIVFGLILLVGMGSLVALQLMPIWLGLVMIIIAGFIVVHTLLKAFRGG